MSNKHNKALPGFTHILRFIIIKISLILEALSKALSGKGAFIHSSGETSDNDNSLVTMGGGEENE